MKKQINKSWKSLSLTTTAAMLIMLGTFGAVFAQDKYPRPDFSEMEEYFEIVDSEYNFVGLGAFIVTAKPKKKAVPQWWTITWRDAKGVLIVSHTLSFNSIKLSQTKIGEPIRGNSYAPEKRLMLKVKSVTITENPDGGDAKTAN